MIAEHPACLSCIAKHAELLDFEVETALEQIQTALAVYENRAGRCHRCGNVRWVVSLKAL